MTAADLQLFPEPENDGSEKEGTNRLGCPPTQLSGEKPHLYTGPDAVEEACERALEALESVERSDPTALPVLSAEDRERAGSLSLLAYYDRYLASWQEARIELGRKAGGIARSSAETLYHHIKAFGRWDLANNPPGWPADVEWPGTPLVRLAGKLAYRIEDFLVSAVSEGNAGTRGQRPWAVKTAVNCCGDLRWVLARAIEQQVIDRDPLPTGFEDRIGAGGDSDDQQQRPPVIFTDAELGRLYAILPQIVADSDEVKIRGNKSTRPLREAITRELRTAIVLAANAGPRAADLLQFEFGKHVFLPDDPGSAAKLIYTQRKMRKRHEIRLAAVTLEHLASLRRFHGRLPGMEQDGPSYLFPHLISPEKQKPLHGEPKRRATALLKEAAAAIGLDVEQYQRPWHVLRHSCTTRFNDHAPGIGKLITHGPDSDVASKSYDNPLGRIAKAVETIGWPAEFLQTD